MLEYRVFRDFIFGIILSRALGIDTLYLGTWTLGDLSTERLTPKPGRMMQEGHESDTLRVA